MREQNAPVALTSIAGSEPAAATDSKSGNQLVSTRRKRIVAMNRRDGNGGAEDMPGLV